MFQRSPGDETNNILIAIYDHTMNASTPIDLQRYITWDKTFDWMVTSSVFYLYISLAISITVAAFALIVSVWLIRYQRSITGAGPTIHDRIRQRHENFMGLMEWGLPSMIEILPMVALVALVLFANFIRYSMCYTSPIFILTFPIENISLGSLSSHWVHPTLRLCHGRHSFRVDGLICCLHSGSALPFAPLQFHQAHLPNLPQPPDPWTYSHTHCLCYAHICPLACCSCVH